MSKAAINQLTKTMSVELARKGVKVASLHPGTVATDLSSKFVSNAKHVMTAEESAHALFKTIQSIEHGNETGIFLDYAGKPIVW
jgi:NAD(P)-dependent dehydrogenase (short-subunit alcohol dehydrogenase family)